MASIRKIEGKKGVSFKITVSQGRDSQDYQIRHYMTWKPPRPDMTPRQMEKEVRRVAFEFERDILRGVQVDNRQTFEEYSKYVYQLREQRGDRPQTLEKVRREMEVINKEIGHLRLIDIRPAHINTLYKKLATPGARKWAVYAVPVVDFAALVGDCSHARSCRHGDNYERVRARNSGGEAKNG